MANKKQKGLSVTQNATSNQPKVKYVGLLVDKKISIRILQATLKKFLLHGDVVICNRDAKNEIGNMMAKEFPNVIFSVATGEAVPLELCSYLIVHCAHISECDSLVHRVTIQPGNRNDIKPIHVVAITSY